MLIADKLQIINETGDLNPNSAVYERAFDKLAHNLQVDKLEIAGVENMMNNVELMVNSTDMVIKKSNKENTNNILIDSKVGFKYGKESIFNVAFLGEEMVIEMIDASLGIEIGNNTFTYQSDKVEGMLYPSESNELFDFYTAKSLFETINSLVKDKQVVAETMYKLRVDVSQGGVVSFSVLDEKDLSNGKLEERRKEEESKKQQIELERQQRLEDKRKMLDEAESEKKREHFKGMQDMFNQHLVTK